MVLHTFSWKKGLAYEVFAVKRMIMIHYIYHRVSDSFMVDYCISLDYLQKTTNESSLRNLTAVFQIVSRKINFR